MKLRQKVILFAIAPLIVALCAIALAVWQQTWRLAEAQSGTVRQAVMHDKETELTHYVALARSSVADLYDSGRADAATRAEAQRRLAALRYGADGYFFLLARDGHDLLAPAGPGPDVAGGANLAALLARADAGGGFVRYLARKPSNGLETPKLAYVVGLPRWGWVLGGGLYLDDVNLALAGIDRQQTRTMQGTMWWIAAIAILAALVVGSTGLALNVSELRLADAKLKVLAQRVVESQEQERARLARDLHDGVSQSLVSVKLQIEAGVVRLGAGPEQHDAARRLFERTADQLVTLLAEVRRISHNLRPAILDDLGLAAALEHLAREYALGSATPVRFHDHGGGAGLPAVANTMLFRIAQEALTNSVRHAGAGAIALHLSGALGRVTLTVADDGAGFDLAGLAHQPQRGIGLRNMMERMEAIGGTLQIDSSAAGTVVRAWVDPLDD